MQVWMTPIKGLYTYIMLISLSVIIMTNDTGGVCDDDEKEQREVKGPPNEVLPLSFKRLASIAKHRKALQSIAKQNCSVPGYETVKQGLWDKLTP